MCILEYTSNISSLTSALKKAEQAVKREMQHNEELSSQLKDKSAECEAAKQESADKEKRLQVELQTKSVRSQCIPKIL